MTTINLDDELINQVITKSHYKNAQEAVSKILSDYLQQSKKTNIIDLLAMSGYQLKTGHSLIQRLSN